MIETGNQHRGHRQRDSERVFWTVVTGAKIVDLAVLNVARGLVVVCGFTAAGKRKLLVHGARLETIAARHGAGTILPIHETARDVPGGIPLLGQHCGGSRLGALRWPMGACWGGNRGGFGHAGKAGAGEGAPSEKDE